MNAIFPRQLISSGEFASTGCTAVSWLSTYSICWRNINMTKNALTWQFQLQIIIIPWLKTGNDMPFITKWACSLAFYGDHWCQLHMHRDKVTVSFQNSEFQDAEAWSIIGRLSCLVESQIYSLPNRCLEQFCSLETPNMLLAKIKNRHKICCAHINLLHKHTHTHLLSWLLHNPV